MDVNYQLIQYGYSIFDYVRKYDLEWIKSMEYLKQFLKINRNRNKLSERYLYSLKDLSIKKKISIPNESIHEIMTYLNDIELVKVSLVCKTWYELSSRKDLWNNLLRTKFSITIDCINIKHSYDKNISSKIVYKQLFETFHKLRKNKISKLKSIIIPSYML